ncbi:hypothetical protein AX16_004565 [Volvariella volvacea WC 439]|nr:hypothetical protein AX16_004565 [Volvariella volvacea WC 439]
MIFGTMFGKRKKLLSLTDTPQAPKLGNIALPSESPLPTVYHPPPPLKSILKTSLPDRRSTTPLPSSSSKSRHDLSVEGQSSRYRTMSMTTNVPLKPVTTRHEDKELMKPHKSGISILVYGFKSMLRICCSPVLSSSSKSRTSVIDQPTLCAGSSSSYVKGGGSSSSSSSYTKPVDWTSSGNNDITCRMNVQTTCTVLPEAHGYRSRKSSMNGYHERPPKVLDSTPKYMKATVSEVPLKAESVALSWPLVEPKSRSRRHNPTIYFDIRFDPIPRGDYGVREHYGSHTTPLSRSVAELPASTHCTLTEMVIYVRDAKMWPIVVNRQEGIRCIDIYQAIYDTFSQRLTDAELRLMDDGYRKRCKLHFEQRCKDSPGIADYHKRMGMLRVDYLRSRRVFNGLTMNPDGTWTLDFYTPHAS